MVCAAVEVLDEHHDKATHSANLASGACPGVDRLTCDEKGPDSELPRDAFNAFNVVNGVRSGVKDGWDLATQTTAGRGFDGKVLFSLSDGSVITPELDKRAQQQGTAVYPGGLAAEIALGDDLPDVEFFDPSGKRTSRQSIGGSLSTGASDLPIVQWPPNKWAVFTPDGDKLLEVALIRRAGRGSLERNCSQARAITPRFLVGSCPPRPAR